MSTLTCTITESEAQCMNSSSVSLSSEQKNSLSDSTWKGWFSTGCGMKRSRKCFPHTAGPWVSEGGLSHVTCEVVSRFCCCLPLLTFPPPTATLRFQFFCLRMYNLQASYRNTRSLYCMSCYCLTNEGQTCGGWLGNWLQVGVWEFSLALITLMTINSVSTFSWENPVLCLTKPNCLFLLFTWCHITTKSH